MSDQPHATGGIVFGAMPPEQRDALLGQARIARYTKGQTILSAGEPGETMIFIETGRVEVSVTSEDGRRSILTQMGSGDVLGDLALLDGGPRSADAVAAGPVTGRILTRRQVQDFLHRQPDLALGLIRELCRKLREANEIHAHQVLTDGRRRLALVLWRLFRKWGQDRPDGSRELTQFVSQSDIGDFAGLARENVNRMIRGWSREGILSSEGRTLILQDADALRDMAGIYEIDER